MASVTMELTDPAKELTALSQLILNSTGGHSTLDGLSKCIGISVDDPEFLEVLAAIQRRLRDVELLASAIDEPDFDQELKNEVISAVHSFGQMFHPKHANGGWDQARTNYLPAKNVQALRFLSQTARRYRPLRVVAIKARDEVLTKISDIMNEVRNDHDLQEWMKTILVSGLERVSLILRHLHFFGHEIAITELFLAHQRLSAIHRGLEAEGSNSFWKTLAILSAAANLFVLPADTVTALDHYEMWISPLLQVITETPPKQRLLPSPTAILPKVGKD